MLFKIAKEIDNNTIVIAPSESSSLIGGLYSYYTPKYYKNPQGIVMDGTPVDCIRFGIKKYNPDLILTGINRGINCGKTMLESSGTFCSAKYGSKNGIKSLAISLDNKTNMNYEDIKKIIFKTLKYKFNLGNLNIVNNELILTQIGNNSKKKIYADISYDTKIDYLNGTDLNIVLNERKSSLSIID